LVLGKFTHPEAALRESHVMVLRSHPPGHFGGNNVCVTIVATNAHRLQRSLGSEQESLPGRPASTLLTASSVVILPAPIQRPKWVQYKEQHRKVDARELIVVHLTGVHPTSVSPRLLIPRVTSGEIFKRSFPGRHSVRGTLALKLSGGLTPKL
jgi:hypothetical protein